MPKRAERQRWVIFRGVVDDHAEDGDGAQPVDIRDSLLQGIPLGHRWCSSLFLIGADSRCNTQMGSASGPWVRGPQCRAARMISTGGVMPVHHSKDCAP